MALYESLIPMTQQQNTIFSLAPNHQELLRPASIQGDNRKVNVAIHFWGVQGVPTPQRTVLLDGVKHDLYIGEFMGTELVETVSYQGKEGQRYAPLNGYLTSGDFLPPELIQYVGEIFPIPPGTNISFLLSDEDVEVIKEFSRESNSYSRNGYQGRTKNAWVIKVEMELNQAMTILSPSATDEEGKINGIRITPSIIHTEPLNLQPGINLMGYSQFDGEFPFTQLTPSETNHPLIAYLLHLNAEKQKYSANKSGQNGSRAYSEPRRNENLPSLPPRVSERTETPTPPSNFMEDEEDTLPRTSTSQAPRVVTLV